MMLRPDDFAAFFREVHGVEPFPWQRRLLEHVAEHGHWPATLDLPTGSGKTAAIDIAVFHLALEATLGLARRAPLRVAFVVDRRLVVDDAYARACKLQNALAAPKPGSITAQVAEALQALSMDGPALLARRLRGGIPRESDWARTPSQPTVLCSTVDQIGSRLLFRGYGVSDSMKPVHAGLIGSDCLILLDEAHLAEPFRQTLTWVTRYRGPAWRQSSYASPWGVALLTATPGQATDDIFGLDGDPGDLDSAHPVLLRRLQAHKPARLLTVSDEVQRRIVFEDEVKKALQAGARAVAVVLNRVARARDLFRQLQIALDAEQVDLLLLIGPARPVQRDRLAQQLAPIRTAAPRTMVRPLVIVATQCIEAGVDIDLDALFTEAAPLDALRQRFGRLNRDGRDIAARAAIVATKEETAARADDAVYGAAIRGAWIALNESAEGAGTARPSRKRKSSSAAVAEAVVDFGIAHFCVLMLQEALSEKPDAPVLMPSHLDLLAQTAPIPGADPEVGLYLHGPSRQPDSVTVIWRADLAVDAAPEAVSRLLILMPPRAAEAISLPVWVVRRWLMSPGQSVAELADVAGPNADDAVGVRRSNDDRKRVAFRWRGPGDDSRWIAPSRVNSGDTIIVPASYGGVDEYGWDPTSDVAAADLANEAADPYRARHFAVRVAPGLLGDQVFTDTLGSVLDTGRLEPWLTVRDALLKLALPDELKARLLQLSGARRRHGRPVVFVDFGAYGAGEDDAPRGVVFVAPRGLGEAPRPGTSDGGPNVTEDDLAGSSAGFAQTLSEHSAEVEMKAHAFAAAAGLPPERIADLKLAGWLHDQGKRDLRFQRWMHHGDPLGADPDDETTVLAKSARALPPSARDKAGLPAYWRHEALSVRMAREHERLRTAQDPDLVLWLVGTHHGHGRPLFPHQDPTESVPEVGPQSLAFDWIGKDWPTLFDTLRARYGTWELARMETILRLADHRASEDAAARSDEI